MYAKIVDGSIVEIKVNWQQLIPNVSVAVADETTLNKFGVYRVREGSQADPTLYFNSPGTVDVINGVPVQTYSSVARPEESVKEHYSTVSKQARKEKEEGGIVWQADSSSYYYITTDESSQAKWTGAVSSVNNNMRNNSGVWKMASITQDSDGNNVYTTVFRSMSDSDILLVGQLVHDHVQKCFEAESNMLTNINSGDYATSYDSEFSKL